jgi:hypothetical protein
LKQSLIPIFADTTMTCRRFLSAVRLALGAVLLAACAAQAAWAQEPGPPSSNKSYVPSYAVVVLTVGLGVWLLVKPTHRRDEARGDGRIGPTPKGMKGDDFHKPH